MKNLKPQELTILFFSLSLLAFIPVPGVIYLLNHEPTVQQLTVMDTVLAVRYAAAHETNMLVFAVCITFAGTLLYLGCENLLKWYKLGR